MVEVGQVWTHKGTPWQVCAVAGADVSLQSYPARPIGGGWWKGLPARRVSPIYNRSKFADADAMRVSADWKLVGPGEAVVEGIERTNA